MKKIPPSPLPGNKFSLTRLTRPIALFLFVILAGVVVIYTAGPVIIERIIINQMHSAGFAAPRAKVMAITPNGLHLSHVSAQEPRLDVDFITITYRLRDLVRGRVDKVLISGLQYGVSLKDNRLDVGFPVSGNDNHPPHPALPFSTPFKTIDVSSSSLVLNYRGKNYLVPFSLTISRLEDSVLDFFSRPVVFGLPVSVQGRTDIHTLETRIDARTSLSDFQGPGAQYPALEKVVVDTSAPQTAGINFRWIIDKSGKGRGNLEIAAAIENLHLSVGGHTAGIEKGDLYVNASMDDQLHFERFETNFQTTGLRFNDFYTEKIGLHLSDTASGFNFSVTVTEPVDGHIEISGKQTSINQLLSNGFSYDADFDWHLRAEDKSGFSNRLTPVDLAVSHPATIAAQGMGRFGFYPQETSEHDRWHIDLDVQEAVVNLAEVFIPEFFLEITDLLFSGSGTLYAGADQLSAEIGEMSIFKVTQVAYEPADASYLVKDIELTPRAKISRNGDGAIQISGSGRTEKNFEALFDETTVLADFLSIEADLNLDFGEALKGLVRARSDIRRVDIPAIDTLISDVKLDIPMGIGGVSAPKGEFSTGAILWNQISWPGIEGRAAIHDKFVQVNGKWPFLSGASLDFSCGITVDPDKGLSGNINANTGWFDLPEKQLLDRLATELETINIDGSVNMGLNLDFNSAIMKPDLRVAFRDIHVTSPTMEMTVSDARGDIRLNSFSPLTTPGNQRIDVSRLKIGEVELVDGFATFRLDSANTLFLEKTSWNLPEGGSITAHSSWFNLEPVSADLEVFFEDIDILKIVARVSEQKIDGSGLVYGRVPILYEQGKVTIGNGFLYSVPGTGRLGIKDKAWLETLLLYVRDAMKGHPYLSTVSERLEQALQDFEYNYLTVNLKKGAEDTSARIELRGRGVEGDPPQEVGSLVINVNDLGEIINRALRFQMTAEESIEKAFDALFDF